MNNQKTKNITLINTIFSLLLQIVTIISGFIIPRLILKTFGSDVNGLVSSLNQFLSYISLIEGGLTGVVLASLYKPLEEKNYNKVSGIVKATNKFFKKLAIIFLVYTLFLSIIYPIVVTSSFSFEFICSLTWILSINLFMQYFFSLTWRILLQADKKVALVSIVQIICIILNTISVVILINIFPDIHVVKLATAIIYLIQPITFNIYIEKHFDITKNVKPDKEAISQRWNGFGINTAAFIHNNTDIILLTILTNLKDVSIYSIYYLVVNGLKSLITSISAGIVPTLGHSLARDDKETINKFFNKYEFIILLMNKSNSFILFSLTGSCRFSSCLLLPADRFIQRTTPVLSFFLSLHFLTDQAFHDFLKLQYLIVICSALLCIPGFRFFHELLFRSRFFHWDIFKLNSFSIQDPDTRF